ncbi:acyltransferase family protein [Paraburkholderia aromaticivorans]|uniref:Acyltransferase 3 domain-containing protein n=1 Tax=Paraburkholderia aromaticivorans TaxID=2026199 RepID=A0A248VQQ7_9BURK|nr:acyltransferase [Paraburkholderia aromaticivorans]ASW01195.1 hypothetical protein CJU94_23650 [Paraburkholderia aromaticivorans]
MGVEGRIGVVTNTEPQREDLMDTLSSKRAGKNVDIQCLRAVAIIFVMLQHYRNRLPTPPLYHTLFDFVAPWTGVDLFFAISGFLVCKTLIEHLGREARGSAFANFWRRRCARLLPALIFWAAASIAVGAFVGASAAQGAWDATKGAIVGVFGVANLYWTYCAQHGASHCVQADYNSHFWSLALEWQLYILLALLVAFFRLRTAMAIFAVIALIASLFSAPSFSYAWALRPQAFFLGALIFVVVQAHPGWVVGPSVQSAWFKRSVLFLGLLVTFCAPNHLSEPFVIPAVSIGAGIALFSTLSVGLTYPARVSRVLEWIGERSYSLYLCHFSVIFCLRKVVAGIPGFENLSPVWTFPPSAFAVVCLSFVAADFSYRKIELPMIKRFSSNKKLEPVDGRPRLSDNATG